MKTVSLWDPWGSLMASGAKRIETRSWPTSHRGVTAIHVARRFDYEQEALLHSPYFRAALLASRYEGIWTGETLPFGHIVALGHLEACIPTRELPHSVYAAYLTDEERAFGDYTPGRFAWVFREVGAIDPIPAKGAQGLWEWTPPPDGWQARNLKDGPEVARSRREAMRRALTGQGHSVMCPAHRGHVCDCHYREMLGFLDVFRTQQRRAAMEHMSAPKKPRKPRAKSLPKSLQVSPQPALF